jgi:hypothetical protein
MIVSFRAILHLLESPPQANSSVARAFFSSFFVVGVDLRVETCTYSNYLQEMG